MEIVATMEAPCPPERLFAWVEDLDRYPDWLEIVTRAERLADDGDDAAWAVDLRGRVGPLARSKRLRMVRRLHRAPELVRFERAELDGRSHSPWTLQAEVARSEPHAGSGAGSDDAPASRLTMTLTYGGGLFGPVLERILRDEIERSRHRLLEKVSTAEPA